MSEGPYLELDLSALDTAREITETLGEPNLQILKLRVRIPVTWAWVKIGWFEVTYATHYAYQITDLDCPYEKAQQDVTRYIKRLETGLKGTWEQLKAGSNTVWAAYGLSMNLEPIQCGLALIMALAPTEILDAYGRHIDLNPHTGIATLEPPPRWSYWY